MKTALFTYIVTAYQYIAWFSILYFITLYGVGAVAFHFREINIVTAAYLSHQAHNVQSQLFVDEDFAGLVRILPEQ